MNGHTGEFAALATALLWTVTALAFEQAAKRVGSLAVNIVRLGLALVFYCILSMVRSGQPFPEETSLHGWIWLSISGLVGFVFGDYCLFSAYALIGSRISNLLMALAPPLAAFFGWLLAGDVITFKGILGMAVTLAGITMVILRKPGKKLNFHYSAKGILLGIGAATGQAVGLVFSKIGMQQSDPFSSSQIRVVAGTIGFIILITALRKWKKVSPAISNSKNLGFISVGSFFGPFLGVSFSLMAVKHTSTGIASTIMALTPVLLIPPAIFLLKEKITWRDLTGSLIAVGGVALFFL
jgi:drug/metabolite transporter (DMT)-like permease